MLAEINLLPKKERKSLTLPLVLATIIVLFLGFGGFFFYTYSQAKSNIETLNSSLETTRKMMEIESTKATTTVNSVTQLENFIEWGQSYPIKTVPVLGEFISLLPQRGFFKSYTYTEQDSVQLTVRFDSSIEASSYLDELLATEWTTEAKLTSLQVTESYYLHEIIGYGEESDIPEMLNEDFVPRYEGIYEIKLDTNFINEKQKEENNVASASSSQEGDGNGE